MPRGRPPKNSITLMDDLEELLSFWNKAVDSPYGIKLMSLKPNQLFQKLHWARRECGHTSYHHLKVIEADDAVWIVPK